MTDDTDDQAERRAMAARVAALELEVDRLRAQLRQTQRLAGQWAQASRESWPLLRWPEGKT